MGEAGEYFEKCPEPHIRCSPKTGPANSQIGQKTSSEYGNINHCSHGPNMLPFPPLSGEESGGGPTSCKCKDGRQPKVADRPKYVRTWGHREPSTARITRPLKGSPAEPQSRKSICLRATPAQTYDGIDLPCEKRIHRLTFVRVNALDRRSAHQHPEVRTEFRCRE